MLQTNLKYQPAADAHREPCLGRLLFTWGLYGFGLLLLWRMIPHGSVWTAAAFWALAGILAAGVAAKLGEI